jgi:hypothetical protein
MAATCLVDLQHDVILVDVARTFGVDRATLYRMRAEAAQ